jgi:hypothetical protein
MSPVNRLDNVRRALFRGACAAALIAGIALPAHGGGPLDLVNHVPVVYANGGTSLTLRIDQGTWARTNAQDTARAERDHPVERRQCIDDAPGARAQLPTDYTLSNYNTVFQNFTDGINPVIFDTNGSITDAFRAAANPADAAGRQIAAGPSAEGGTRRALQAFAFRPAVKVVRATAATAANAIPACRGLEQQPARRREVQRAADESRPRGRPARPVYQSLDQGHEGADQYKLTSTRGVQLVRRSARTRS